MKKLSRKMLAAALAVGLMGIGGLAGNSVQAAAAPLRYRRRIMKFSTMVLRTCVNSLRAKSRVRTRIRMVLFTAMLSRRMSRAKSTFIR